MRSFNFRPAAPTSMVSHVDATGGGGIVLEILVTATEFTVMALVVFGSGLLITGHQRHPALDRDTTSPVLWMAE
jgi:hypothetical protein